MSNIKKIATNLSFLVIHKTVLVYARYRCFFVNYDKLRIGVTNMINFLKNIFNSMSLLGASGNRGFSIISVIMILMVCAFVAVFVFTLVNMAKTKKKMSKFDSEGIIEKVSDGLKAAAQTVTDNINDVCTCEYCGGEYKKSQSKCPHCGGKNTKKKQ